MEPRTELALRGYLDGRIDGHGLITRSEGDAEGLGEIAWMLFSGEGAPIDDDTCADAIDAAYEAGNTEIAWRILEAPEREGEEIDDWRCPRQTALLRILYPERMEVVDGVPSCTSSIDRSMLPGIEACAFGHPEIAATLICGNHAGGLSDLERWEKLAKDAFKAQTLYWLGIRYGEYGSIGLLQDCIERSAELGYPEALLATGQLWFCGCITGWDYGKAERYLKVAEAAGMDEAGVWLMMYEPLPSLPIRAAEPVSGIGGFAGSRWRYKLPYSKELVPEMPVLWELTGQNIISPIRPFLRYRTGKEFDNRTFRLTMSYLGPEDSPEWAKRTSTPNIWFKPTGLEIYWGEHLDNRLFTNRRVDLLQVRHILRICIETVADGDFGDPEEDWDR